MESLGTISVYVTWSLEISSVTFLILLDTEQNTTSLICILKNKYN
jgi:hypothetical protein